MSNSPICSYCQRLVQYCDADCPRRTQSEALNFGKYPSFANLRFEFKLPKSSVIAGEFLEEEVAEMRPEETIDHPPHYNAHPSGVECIDIVEHFNFNVGNAIKYIWRAGLKSENRVEDLKKAAWYIQREIARMEKDIFTSE